MTPSSTPTQKRCIRVTTGWVSSARFVPGRFKLIDAPRPSSTISKPIRAKNTASTRSGRHLPLPSSAGYAREQESRERASGAPRSIRCTAARLAALGYISGSVVVSEPKERLADPKDKIGLYQLITGDRKADVTSARQEYSR